MIIITMISIIIIIWIIIMLHTTDFNKETNNEETNEK